MSDVQKKSGKPRRLLALAHTEVQLDVFRRRVGLERPQVQRVLEPDYIRGYSNAVLLVLPGWSDDMTTGTILRMHDLLQSWEAYGNRTIAVPEAVVRGDELPSIELQEALGYLTVGVDRGVARGDYQTAILVRRSPDGARTVAGSVEVPADYRCPKDTDKDADCAACAKFGRCLFPPQKPTGNFLI